MISPQSSRCARLLKASINREALDAEDARTEAELEMARARFEPRQPVFDNDF